MTISPNIFSKCAPALSTNIRQCGTVTLCNAQPLTQGDLTTAYMKSGDYRVMEALLYHDFEIKMCEAVQNGLYDFMMANKKNWSDKMSPSKVSRDYLSIAPFVKGKQYSPINNEYWLVTGIANVTVDGTAYWQVRVTSSTNIPASTRSFPDRQRVFIDGKTAGGVATKTAWVVAEVTNNGDNTLTLLLLDQNSASNLAANKVGHTATAIGIMKRGTANINDYERFCAEPPAYLNWKLVPFWIETTRTSMCKSSLYDQWRTMLMSGNPLYREFGDLDDIEKNKQLANDWQRRLVNQMFWGKPLPNQTMAAYDQLEDILSFDGGVFGVDGAKCIGKRANAVGIYEQLAECGRVTDLAQGKLYFLTLFQELYNMMRVRQGNGAKNPKVFDIFTDSMTASILNQAFILYYKAQSQNLLQLNYPVGGFSEAKKAEFGFMYQSYPLFWPQGVVVNVITHEFFDDYITAAAINDGGVGVAYANTARVLWILDFPGIYPGILASNRMVNSTGDLKKLAEINPTFACVMKVNSQEQTLTSTTWTMVVECPKSSLIIENFAIDTGTNMPNVIDQDPSGPYPPTTTTTTTTTVPGFGTFTNDAQTYIASCPDGFTGLPQTVTIAAATSAYTSTISKSDANAKAMAAAQTQAIAELAAASPGCVANT